MCRIAKAADSAMQQLYNQLPKQRASLAHLNTNQFSTSNVALIYMHIHTWWLGWLYCGGINDIALFHSLSVPLISDTTVVRNEMTEDGLLQVTECTSN